MSQKVARPNPLTLRLALFGALLMLAGCFQPAGSDLQPTTVDLLALTAIVTETPTLTPTSLVVLATEAQTLEPTVPVLPSETVAAPDDPTEQPEPGAETVSPTPFDMVPSPTLPPDSPFASTVTPGSPQALVAPATDAAAVPGLLPTPTALPTSDPCFYVVQPGEWPYSIARKLEIDAQSLIAANPAIASGQLQPGDRLIVPNCQPGATPTPPPPAAEPTLASEGPAATPIPVIDRIYTVADGDTLGSIARKFNTTVRELQIVNNMRDGDFIRAGQELRIPEPAQ
jgi:LysM repeat protein